MMPPEQAVFAAILLSIAGSLLTLVAARFKTLAGWLAFAFTTASAVLIFYAVQRVLASGPSPHFATFLRVVHFHVDGLSALFLLLAAVIAVLAALYSVAYMRHYRDYGLTRYCPNFLLLLAGIYGLLSASDMMAADNPSSLRPDPIRPYAGKLPRRLQIPAADGTRVRRNHDRNRHPGRAGPSYGFS